MSAQKKIEKLTDSWYGFALFTAICNVLSNGIGIFALILSGGILVWSLFVTFIVGRNLQRRGKITRLLCLAGSALGTLVFGALSVFGVTGFLGDWSFGGLFQIAVFVTATLMHVRSFRTLTDAQVKSFITG